MTRLSTDDAFKVKVLINFAPQQGSAASMQPIDTSALVSILRNISREPRICKFSVVAFNMNEQRVRLPAGRRRPHRFSRAGQSAVVAETRHGRLQKTDRSAQRQRFSGQAGGRMNWAITKRTP